MLARMHVHADEQPATGGSSVCHQITEQLIDFGLRAPSLRPNPLTTEHPYDHRPNLQTYVTRLLDNSRPLRDRNAVHDRYAGASLAERKICCPHEWVTSDGDFASWCARNVTKSSTPRRQRGRDVPPPSA